MQTAVFATSMYAVGVCTDATRDEVFSIEDIFLLVEMHRKCRRKCTEWLFWLSNEALYKTKQRRQIEKSKQSPVSSQHAHQKATNVPASK